ncbi:DsbA family protein [Candidatus Woesearchaeota archaeon]|nr:DsbA family protein [Candidatus Woesearchaeota archaeon]
MSNEDSKDSITISKTTLWQLLAGVFALLFVGAILTDGFKFGDKDTGKAVVQPSPPTPTQQPNSPEPQPSAPIKVNEEGAAGVKGNSNAPVLIVEYSDYQCPFCGRFFDQTLPSILKEYVDTGKVRLAYKDLPLSFHPNADDAALAARCAADQGKFWEMHDKLFETQDLWSGLPDATSTLVQYAKDLSLDAGKFETCLKNKEHWSEIQANMQEAEDIGATGTPSFVINGQLVVGAQPYSVFKQVIDSEL